MQRPFHLLASIHLAAVLSGAALLHAQAPGVPIYEPAHSGKPASEEQRLREQVEALRKGGQLLEVAAVRSQIAKDKVWTGVLPKPERRPLAAHEIWERARASYLRVGYYYLCGKCTNWHMNMAGAYAIAKDGVAVTCHHVLAQMDIEMKEGFLFAADDQGNAYPVTDILAVNAGLDTAIVKTAAVGLPPRPLNTEVRPGDRGYLFSDPKGNRGFFSEGMVNRFVKTHFQGKEVIRMNVGTDWAPGSSGAAILDVCGNAIGHVSTIHTVLADPKKGAEPSRSTETLMVLHAAVRAADVLSLVAPVPR